VVCELAGEQIYLDLWPYDIILHSDIVELAIIFLELTDILGTSNQNRSGCPWQSRLGNCSGAKLGAIKGPVLH